MAEEKEGLRGGKRFYEKILRIDARQEDVWRAISEGDEITRWFSTDASVKPGKGGEIYMAWEGDFKGTSSIEIWDPPNHLRSVDQREAWQASEADAPGAEPPSAVPLTVDYYLSTEKGQTVLRLVHSGFGAGSEWDEEFDAIKRGWGAMLLNMTTYVERHFGKETGRCWRQFKRTEPAAQVWESILSGLGFKSAPPEGTSLQSPVDNKSAVVDVLVDGFELGIAVGDNKEQLIRFSIYQLPEGSLLWYDHLAYGFDDAAFTATNDAWMKHFGSLLKQEK